MRYLFFIKFNNNYITYRLNIKNENIENLRNKEEEKNN